MVTISSLPRLGTLVLAAAALSAIGADCEGNIVKDPTFRDWCGDTLCSWHLDAGNIKRVPTWNQNDFGVSFEDGPTVISQVTDENQATCILFTTVADIDPSAQMSVWVDFNDDGTFESMPTLGATRWHQVQAEITAPAAYNGIRFVVRKDGTGTAVLAEMRIQSSTGCTAAPPTIADLAIGERCANDADCASRVCQTVFLSKVCAQCSASQPCADNATCQTGTFGFGQCSPGQHLGAKDDPCITGDDCASGSCKGATIIPGDLTAEGGACDPTQPASTSNCYGDTVRGGTCL
ncbi:MAG TPA: GEVED domain-containing protein [Polyangiaceae bacterium]|jgi:hypothetical protein